MTDDTPTVKELMKAGLTRKDAEEELRRHAMPKDELIREITKDLDNEDEEEEWEVAGVHPKTGAVRYRKKRTEEVN